MAFETAPNNIEAEDPKLTPLFTGKGTRLSRYQFFEGCGRSRRWRLHHRNGTVPASRGEGYTSRTGVGDPIESVTGNVSAADFGETAV